MIDIINKAKSEHDLTKDEIIFLLSCEDGSLIFKAADEIRKQYVGDEVHLRALIEFSNICRCNCVYCGLRSQNRDVERYRLSKKQILESAQKAADFGYKTIVLQSGEDVFFTADYLAEIIKEIKNLDVAVTLSIGERTFEEYKILKDAGADRFLLRIETTDKKLYEKCHPNANFENRVRCLRDLKKLGFETGTGCLVGLPEQTIESLADDILFFKDLDADMIGIGPLIVHPHTPLKDKPNGNFDLALRVMSLTRLLMPDINIPATTAMETLNPQGRIIALQSGANVVMPNLTDNDARVKYEIYPNKAGINYTELSEKLSQIGRTISCTKGFRGNKNSPLSLNPTPAGRGKNVNLARTLRKNMTPQETKFWNLVRNNQFQNIKFKRQYPIGPYIVDFIAIQHMLVVELDGGGHNTDSQQKYDIERAKYITSRGFKILRFWNNDIDNNIEGVFETISQALRDSN